MKILFFSVLTLTYTISFSQYSYQNASSIISNSNPKTNEVSAETSFEFNHFQLTGIYNVSEKIFVHSNLNLNVLQQNADRYSHNLFGGKPIKLHTNDLGYGFGFGLQNIAKAGKFKMQLVFSYDYEKQKYSFNEKRLNEFESLVDSMSNQNNNLYKVSSDINFVKNTDKYNLIYLLRLSYCKFTKFQYNNEQLETGKSGFAIVEPAVEIDFKLLKNKNLFIVTQFGLSLPLSIFGYSYKADLPFDATNETSSYLLDTILKLGVKYNFCKK